MKKAVGIILITILNGEKVALLQRRGKFNPEKMKPESFPGACQVSAHGGLEKEEDFIDALLREVSEELGEDLANVFYFESNTLSLISDKKTEKKHMKTYSAFLENPDFLKEVRLGSASGGLELLSETSLSDIQDLSTFSKEEGVIDTNIIAMFSDEIEAVKKAFELYE